MASKKADPQFIYEELLKMFPEAHCELNFSTVYQLAVAEMLSAQTTDVSVNRVTGTLFERYPDAEAMSKAEQKDVEEIIKSIGLQGTVEGILKLAKEKLGLVDPDTVIFEPEQD